MIDNKTIETCDCLFLHEHIVKKAQENSPKEEVLLELADLFKVLGDGTRMKILAALFEGEMCVCDIAYLLQMTQSAISHQLRVLKQARLIKSRKEGKVVFYEMADEHVQLIFNQGLTHVLEK